MTSRNSELTKPITLKWWTQPGLEKRHDYKFALHSLSLYSEQAWTSWTRAEVPKEQILVIHNSNEIIQVAAQLWLRLQSYAQLLGSKFCWTLQEQVNNASHFGSTIECSHLHIYSCNNPYHTHTYTGYINDLCPYCKWVAETEMQ